jgi:hypothetical protein
MAKKMPKYVMHAAYSKKIIQNSKNACPEFVATPHIVKQIAQKSSVEKHKYGICSQLTLGLNNMYLFPHYVNTSIIEWYDNYS